jgi:hypothetical protein
MRDVNVIESYFSGKGTGSGNGGGSHLANQPLYSECARGTSVSYITLTGNPTQRDHLINSITFVGIFGDKRHV